MIILAIDTSCDETAAAVTKDDQILSNVIWSQASLHSKFGGVMPSLAARQHEERIDWVINKAIKNSKIKMQNLDAIAVTVGPGLGIALGVGISHAKELAKKYNKPLIPINHIEAHILSSLAKPKTENLKFPALGLVLSGGTTLLCLIKNIGDYEILAETQDDALGETLDKAARLLGLGYPGAAFLEKLAKSGNPNKYKLPIPLIEDKVKNRFSYSGLKTAFVRFFNSTKNPTKQDICDLAACFQFTAFDHVARVLEFQVVNYNLSPMPYHLLFGGGVANNIEIRKVLRKVCKKHNIKLLIPSSKKLMGDNAGMIGITANLKFKSQNLKLNDFLDYDNIDRNPKLNLINQP